MLQTLLVVGLERPCLSFGLLKLQNLRSHITSRKIFIFLPLSPHSTGLIVAFSLSMIPEFRQVAISACDVTFKDSKVEETIRLARIEAEVAAETNEALMQA